MKIKILLTGCLLTFGIFSHTYAQKNLLELIPKEAIFVANLNAVDIDSKLNWKTMADYSVSEELAGRASAYLGLSNSRFILDFIKDPKSMGLDFPAECFVFSEIAGDKKYLNFIAPIADAAKFKAQAESFFGDKFNNSIVQKGNQLVFIQNSTAALSWNKDFAIISFIFCDKANDESDEAYSSRKRISLDAYLDKINAINGAKSMSSHGGYKNWKTGVRDAGLWVNYKEIMKLGLENDFQSAVFPGRGATVFMEIAEVLVNSYGEINIASDIAFEKGEILSNSAVYMGKELMDFSKSATCNRANKKMLKYIDGQKAGMYMIMATSPKGVYDGWKNLLKEKAGSYKSSVDDLFGIMEIFIDEKDAFNFLKGDMFYAINGLKTIEKVETEYEYNSETDEYLPVERKIKEQIPLLTFGFSYGNKEDMLKFVRLINRTGFLKKEKKDLYRLYIPFVNEAIFVKMDKGLMVFSNDEQRMLQNKKYRPLSKQHYSYLKNDFQTIHVNTGALMDILSAVAPQSDLASVLKNIKDGVGDMTMHSVRPKKEDSQLSQHFKIELKNKEENALKQIFDFANRVYQRSMKGI